MGAPKYVGWIPNVAGRLSFSHIGDTRNPGGRIHKINAGDSRGRLVICYQSRRCSDTLLPSWYFRWLYGQEARCAFLLCLNSRGATGDAIGELHGTLYLVDERRKVDDEYWDGPFPLWSMVSDEIGSAKVTTTLPWRTHEGRDTILQSIDARCGSCAWGKFSVIIKRDGIVELCPDDRTRDVRAVFGFDFAVAEDHDGIIDFVANQAYFFVRDICHTHQHHSHSADTITTVSSDDGWHNWVPNTNYRLHRKILHMRQSRSPVQLIHALGLTAYISSFDRLARRYTSDDNPVLSYNIQNIESSLKAKIDVARWRQTQSNIVRTAFPAIFIAILSLNKDASISKFARAAIDNLFQNTIYGWFLVCLLLAQVPYYYGIYSYFDLPLIHQSKRILAGLSKSTQGSLWLFLAGFAGVFFQSVFFIFSKYTVLLLWCWALLDVFLCFAIMWTLPVIVTIGDVMRLKVFNRSLPPT